MAPRVGLVLGAGGIVGQAYHAGVLAALEHDLGWDPRTADIIVGSSAGSVTGTLLRVGVPASDLAAWAVEAPLSVESAPLLEALGGGEAPEIPPFDWRDALRPWRTPAPALVARAARRPWRFRPAVAMMTLLPSGRVDITEHTDTLDPIVGDAWLDGLWICATRRRDGRRVVFGRPGSPDAPLTRAVAASCSIPGYFSPVRIGGVSYIDGGVHSPTSADVLADQDLDLVVAVSPMSSAHGRSWTPDASVRRMFHNRLELEVRRLRRRGTAVVRFEPTARVLSAMGLNAMAGDRADSVVQTSFIDAGRHAATERVSALLAPLRTRRRGSGAIA